MSFKMSFKSLSQILSLMLSFGCSSYHLADQQSLTTESLRNRVYGGFETNSQDLRVTHSTSPHQARFYSHIYQSLDFELMHLFNAPNLSFTQALMSSYQDQLHINHEHTQQALIPRRPRDFDEIDSCPEPIFRTQVDRDLLRERLSSFKFRRPRKLRALILEIEIREGCVVSERAFAWGNQSHIPYGWIVGSGVKPFAAIGALERLRRLGFDSQTQVSFYHRSKPEVASCLAKTKECTVKDLVYLALKRSDNIAYNRLVQLAGYDALNGDLLSPRRGIKSTGLHSPYARRTWRRRAGGARSFRDQPQIILKSATREHTIPARTYSMGRRGQYHCPGGGTCASLADLVEMTRRIFLHDQIPYSERYRLNLEQRQLVRESLKTRRVRMASTGFVRALERELPPNTSTFHKNGYARRWASDVVYIDLPGSHRRWVIAAAGRSGRRSLISLGRALGQLISDPDVFQQISVSEYHSR